MLAVSLLLNALFLLAGLAFVRRKGGWRYVKGWLDAKGLVRDRLKERLENAYGLTKAELYALYGTAGRDVVFLGDSLTDFCAWNELLELPEARNRGISGDTTETLAARLSPVLAGRPRAIFLMAGINDLNNGEVVEAVFARYQAIVRRVGEESPGTRLYVQSVLPVDTTRWGFSAAERIRAFNRALAGLADGERVQFVDLYGAFADGDKLDARLSHDGLHLNGEGYRKWREALVPLLSTL